MSTFDPPSPPPLPSPARPTPPETPAPAFDIPWQFWIAVLALVPLADICLYRVNLHFWPPASGAAVLLFATGLLAVFVSGKRAKLAPGAIVFGLSLLALLLEPGWANTASLFTGLALLAWVAKGNDTAWGLLEAPLNILEAPFVSTALAGESALALFRRPVPPKLRRISIRSTIGLVFPAFLVSVFFLWLLSRGNAALAEWLSRAFAKIGLWISAIAFPDFTRILFWLVVYFAGILLFSPARRCGKPSRFADTLSRRWKAPADPARPRLQWLLALVGVNLVFLLTNTLDVVYLWMRQAAPAGVSTTEYLHEGVYSLIFTTILAGILLAFIFNGGTNLTRSRPLHILGLVWVAQNIFLIGGVAFRLWLHIGSFCLTPRRLGVAFFLVLVLAGFALLVFYVVREKSLRWLLANNILAVFSLFFAVQFCDINGWCASSAIAKRKEAPLRINGIFLQNIGLPAWRVVKALADEEIKPGTESDPSRINAKRCWEAAQRNLRREGKKNDGTPSSPAVEASWREWSWRASRERSALCEALGAPGEEAQIQGVWREALKASF
ncbi:MAG: DUF4173 domain-containing protein [Puniceicoccales bacterium]|jgi:hypothetical protein|nr:DUF4173 domain-containing protein [Puniceicoccales bacterium]